ncbi:hypothetical protein VHEMI06407 [[Torrubiella] hemipterigena]|uniref:DUF7707 domain-containing protein n=1 Tax=[Torrubiella] hemipterigena TaxID=1531966 RepID=A0A0A1T769_9HYPO|nr:hypothetical protein VHEMI06407 [[Torrubiella] hemipterigena]
MRMAAQYVLSITGGAAVWTLAVDPCPAPSSQHTKARHPEKRVPCAVSGSPAPSPAPPSTGTWQPPRPSFSLRPLGAPNKTTSSPKLPVHFPESFFSFCPLLFLPHLLSSCHRLPITLPAYSPTLIKPDCLIALHHQLAISIITSKQNLLSVPRANMLSKVAVLVALASYATAQIPDYKSSLDMLQGLDVNSIDPGTRNTMCIDQIITCGVLCNNNNDANTCDETTLQYTCTCSSNHSSPALQYYSQTLPNSVCNLVTFPNCINKYTEDHKMQEQCKPKIQDVCGKATFGSSANPTSASAPSKTSGTSQDGSTVSTSSKSAFAAPTAIPLGAAAAAGVVALFL